MIITIETKQGNKHLELNDIEDIQAIDPEDLKALLIRVGYVKKSGKLDRRPLEEVFKTTQRTITNILRGNMTPQHALVIAYKLGILHAEWAEALEVEVEEVEDESKEEEVEGHEFVEVESDFTLSDFEKNFHDFMRAMKPGNN